LTDGWLRLAEKEVEAKLNNLPSGKIGIVFEKWIFK